MAYAPPAAKRPRTRSCSRELLEVHEKDSPMHQAIEKLNLRLVTKLLGEGDRLCTGKGLNCFILAATSKEQNMGWNLLLKMLELKPAGLEATDSDGITLLMKYVACPSRIQALVHLGADINKLDDKGESVLTKLFFHQNVSLKEFKQLLDLGASVQAMEIGGRDNFQSVMESVFDGRRSKSRDERRSIVEHLSETNLVKENFWCNKEGKHLLFILLAEVSQFGFSSGCGRSSMEDRLREFLQLKLFKSDLAIYTCIDEKNEMEQGFWGRMRHGLGIPQYETFDPAAYFLFSAGLDMISTDHLNLLTHLLERFASRRADSVHPVHALLYNVNIKTSIQVSENDLFLEYDVMYRFPIIAKVIVEITNLLQNTWPVPHHTQHHLCGVFTNTIDLMALMSPMFVCPKAYKILLPFYQLGPLTPTLQIINCSVLVCLFTAGTDLRRLPLPTISSTYFELKSSLNAEAASAHIFDYQELRKFIRWTKSYGIEIDDISPLISKINSLSDMCKWKLRNLLFAARRGNTDTLPAVIRRLKGTGLLSKQVHDMLLIYDSMAIAF